MIIPCKTKSFSSWLLSSLCVLSPILGQSEETLALEKQAEPEKIAVPEKQEPPKETLVLEKQKEPEKIAVPEKQEPSAETLVLEKQKEPEKIAVPEKQEPPKETLVLEKQKEPEKVAVPEKQEPSAETLALEKQKEPEKVAVPEKNDQSKETLVLEKQETSEEIAAPEKKDPSEEVDASEKTVFLYPVSQFTFKYVKQHPQQIPLEELNRITLSLIETAEGFFSPKEQEDVPEPYRQVDISIGDLNHSGKHYFSQQALAEILDAGHQFFEDKKIRWSYLFIGGDQITAGGQDLRDENQEDLVVEISVPTVQTVNVKPAENSSLKNDTFIKNQTSRIEQNFPLSLPDPSTGYPGSYIDPDALNNYLYSLNRHPGKRVDVEIGPTVTPGGVTLDFVINEERPYHFYVSATNNIPKVIHEWQESVGFLHTQLTGNDDILKLNYTTDGFDSFYTAFASYEAPWGKTVGKRWSVSGSFNRFLSAEFGLAPNLFRGTQKVADLEFIGNIYQRGRFFVEAFGILEYRHIHNRKHAINHEVSKNFIFPAVGLKAVALTPERKLIASLQLESTISTWFWDVKKGLDNLGRRHISPSWAFVHGSLYYSFYVEPLFKETVIRMANEFLILGQFQNAFNSRLIPQLEGVLGGVTTVRGYPQSTVAGDNMYMASAEYRLHIPQLLKPNCNAIRRLFNRDFRYAPAEPKGRADWDLILRAFYDLGKTTNNRRVKGEKNYVVDGIGWGIDFVLWSNLVLKYDWAVALKSANGTKHGHKQQYFSAVLMY